MNIVKALSMRRTVRYLLTGLIVVAMAGATAQTDSIITKTNTYDIKQKNSVGIIIGYSLLPGITYKHSPCRHFSLETDFNSKVLITGKLLSDKANHIVIPLLELSENALYQHSFAVKKNVSYQYVFGGGINGAMQPLSPVIWKVGVNAFAGMEFVFLDRPVTMQVDIRPGYGLLLRSAKTIEEQKHYWDMLTPGLNKNPQSCFDWSINFSIRFRENIQ